jgi:YVTN family beta-propeller protein
MKNLFVALLLVLTCLTWHAQAAPTATITFQGYLTDTNSVPLTAATDMTLALYPAPTGGTPLWSEHQTGVQVSNGIYSIQMGSVSPITLPFDAVYYLGIAVGSDPEMTPRQELSAVPYAFRANSADKLNQSCNDGEVLKYSTAASSWSCALAAGPQGPQGPVGPQGVAGPQGTAGANGSIGLQGPTGATGATGPVGAAGSNGTNGAQGIQGIPGTQGIQGAQGPAGASPFALTGSDAVYTAGSVGIGVTPPDATAVLDVSSTTKGFLAPRLTAAQIALINTPATGLLVYQTDNTAGFYFFNGASWAGPFSTSSGSYPDLTNKPALGALAAKESIANADVAVGAAIATAKLSGPVTAIAGNGLADVAASGNYGDLTNKPALGALAAKETITNADVAVGAAISTAKLSGPVTAITGHGLAGVAFSGSYADLNSKPVAGTDYLAPTGDGSTLTGITKTQVGLGNIANLKSNMVAVSDPTNVNDTDNGYSIGSRWMNTAYGREFVCTDATSAAAVWKETTSPAGLQVNANLIDLASPSDARVNLGIATVGNTGSYNDLTDKPTLGALAAKNQAVLTTDVTGILPLTNGGTGSSNGSISGSGPLTFAAGGFDQNVTLTPSGNGYTLLNGNVGIGVSPSEKLHIRIDTPLGSTAGDFKSLTRLDIPMNSPNTVLVRDYALRDSDNSEWTTTSYVRGFDVDNAFSAPNLLKTWTRYYVGASAIAFGDGGTEWLRINNFGNLGIGVSNPVYKLDVAGGANVSGELRIGGNFGIGGTPGERFHILADTPLGNTAGEYKTLTRFDVADHLNTFRVKDIVLRESDGADWTTDSYLKGIDVDGAFTTPQTLRSWIKHNPAATYIAFGDAGNEWMRIFNGQVGIGTATPGYKLDVAGDVNVSGAFKIAGNPLAVVARSGSYNDLADKPALATVATTSSYADLSGKPSLGALAAKAQADLTSDVTGVLPVANGGTGSSTGSITGSGALSFSAGGGNADINLAPTGTGTVNVAAKRITGVATPSSSTDAATKGYVDTAVAAISGAAGVTRTPLQIATLAWYDVNYALPDITVGLFPFAIAFDGEYMWVIHYLAASVTKIKASTGVVAGTYAVGSYPTAITFDGTYIWVSNLGNSNNVTKLKASDGSFAGTYSVGGNPFAAAFDGTHVWFSSMNTSDVTKIRAIDGSTVGAYNVGNGPQGLAFDGSNIWVANGNDFTISKLDAATGSTLGTYTVGSDGGMDGMGTHPRKIIFDGSNIWVSIAGDSNAVLKVRPSDGSILATYSGFSDPGALAFDGQYIWVVDQSDNTLKKINAGTGSLVATVAAGNNPYSIAFDGSHIWVTTGPSGAVNGTVIRR